MKKVISIILVIIWMIIIFIMSSFDATRSSNQSNIIVNLISIVFNISNLDILSLIIRKIAHLTEYLILSILVCNMIHKFNIKNYIGIIISVLYAISDEIHQIFIPGRSCQIVDILIDTLGIILGYITYKYILKINSYIQQKFKAYN